MSADIHIDGHSYPICIRRNARAKRIILRLNTKSEGVIVTLPYGVSEKEAYQMAERHKVWISNQLLKHPKLSSPSEGGSFPVRGQSHHIVHSGKKRGLIQQDETSLIVSGEMDFLKRRLKDWLIQQAKQDITPQAYELADKLNKKINHISFKDTKTRWGSCSSGGNLSFNWRLIMAPPEILRYVVAHEVSHLAHMNHSADFWETVHFLFSDHKRARHWLKRHGSSLQNIQF